MLARAWGRAVPAILGIAGIAWFLGWQIAHHGIFQYTQGIYAADDADEWRYTACSTLVEHGYALFSQVFSAQPPLLFLSLAGGMRLFGDTIAAARSVEIAFGLIGLLAAGWIAFRWTNGWGAAATLVLLAVSPAYLLYSHTVEAEGPMMALATLSLAILVLPTVVHLPPRRDLDRSAVLLPRIVLPAGRDHAVGGVGETILVVVAGLVLAAAILTKLFALEALVPALFLLLTNSPRRLRDSAVFLVAALLPVVLEFLLVSPAQQWRQAVSLHTKISSFPLPNTVSTLHILRNFLTFDLGLTLVAVAGFLVLLASERWRTAAFFFLWVGGELVMLVVFHPLFPHHPAILLTGMGALGGVGIGTAVDTLPLRRVAALPLAIAFLAYLILVPRLVHDDRHLLVPGSPPRVVQLTRFVKHRLPPGSFIATDDLAVADQARLLVPPPLCDPSSVRLHAGYLTARTLKAATRRYHALMVLPTFGIYPQVPAYMAWVRGHYRLVPAPLGNVAYVKR